MMARHSWIARRSRNGKGRRKSSVGNAKMLHYKSMPKEHLREIWAVAGAELLSRKAGEVSDASQRHMYRITMRRASKAEPQALRFTKIEGIVVPNPVASRADHPTLLRRRQ
jgi:hypothetical protein